MDHHSTPNPQGRELSGSSSERITIGPRFKPKNLPGPHQTSRRGTRPHQPRQEGKGWSHDPRISTRTGGTNEGAAAERRFFSVQLQQLGPGHHALQISPGVLQPSRTSLRARECCDAAGRRATSDERRAAKRQSGASILAGFHMGLQCMFLLFKRENAIHTL